MALRGFPELKIELDASGGSLVNISAFVTSIGGWTKEALTEELTAAGDTTDRWAAVGITQKSTIELSGPYDDAANSLVALTKDAAALGATRTLQLTFDGATAADVETVECIIMSVARNPQRGQFHGYAVVLRPTGAIT